MPSTASSDALLYVEPVYPSQHTGRRPPGGPESYDYRRQWVAFTRRLSRTHTANQVARELTMFVEEAGATSVAVYLAGVDRPGYRLSASSGSVHFAQSVSPAAAAPWLGLDVGSAPLTADILPSVMTPSLPTALGVPLRWRTMLLGFIVLVPPGPGTGHAAEDVDFLSTVADQAVAAIVAARSPEAAIVTHDLKNSVSALSLLASNVPGNFADPAFQRDAIATLSRTVARMRRLLVRLAAPDATASAPNSGPIDLRELILEATASLEIDARVRLVRRLHPVPMVHGDRDALLRVVENLTTNAAEAIDGDGTVTVTLAQKQGHAVISVADTGCGMSEEYQERHLFSPFHSTKKGGWGIGLYQTKQAVENQHGEILVESAEGHGTTFTVKLPLRAGDAESPSLESVR